MAAHRCFATATAAKEARVRHRLFPTHRELPGKDLRAGKIPADISSARVVPTEKETLTSRLIDRPIRPLFASGFRNETQVVATVLSHDMENDPDIVAMIATSAALTLSGIPFLGRSAPRASAISPANTSLNPMIDEMRESTLDLVVAGTADAVLMVESEAKELPRT
jgi:polyribonucleotide nucleotidyltransferase